MAKHIRTFDWSKTPLGPLKRWPASLKVIVQLMLAQNTPACVIVGEARTLIYNASYAAMIGSRHPLALGQNAIEAFPELTISDYLARTMRGETVTLLDKAIPFMRHDVMEIAWFNVTLSPARDEAGEVFAVFAAITETTAQMQVEAALREGEQRYRTLFEAIDEGFCIIEMIFGENGTTDDYRVLAANPSFAHLTGLFDPVGKTMREMEPAHEQHWYDTYANIARTGEPQRFERRAETLGYWYSVYAFRVGAAEQNRVGILFQNITDRRRADDTLRESEERQAFLLKLSDALASIADASAIMETASRMLGEHLRVNRVLYAEIEQTRGSADGIMRAQFVRGAALLPTRIRHDDFTNDFILETYRNGRPLIITDTMHDPRFGEDLRARWLGISIGAAIAIPLLKQGREVVLFAVHQSVARAWTPAEVTLVNDVAERTWAAAQRASVETALRQSEARITQLVTLMPAAMYTCDAEGHLTYFNRRAVELWGRTPRLGDAQEKFCGSFRMWTADGQPVMHHACPMAHAVREGRSARNMEVVIEQPSGTRIFVQVNIDPLYDDDGRLAGAINVFQDVTEQKRAEAALAESEERFQQFSKASSAAIWIRSAHNLDMEYVSPAITHIYGVEPHVLLGDVKHWAALIVPEDRDNAMAHIDRARHGESVVHEFRIQRPSDKAFRWIRNIDFPLRDADDIIQRIGGVAEDITDTKLAVEHQAVLLAELQHRVRNIMAIIRSITTRTGESASSVAEYAKLMAGRLLTLARVQTLLTRAANAGVNITTIVQDEIAAQAQHTAQYTITGPDVTLAPKAAEILTLALHELATNALKYGALSGDDGHIAVTWHVVEKQGAPWLAFDWKETGAPVRPRCSPAAPRRKGFGSELIEARLPYELGGRGCIEITPAGAQCHLEFPLREGASILETDAPQHAAVRGGALDMTGQADLHGQRILVIEDDYYLAADTMRALQGAGAETQGPCPTEDTALDELAAEAATGAVVDINLGPGPSFKVAEILKQKGVPFIFITGYDEDVIPPDFADVPRLQKPVDLKHIVNALAQVLGAPRA